MANFHQQLARLAEPPKTAQDGLPAFADVVQSAVADRMRGDALVDVRNMALAALGVGAGLRGATGLYNLARRSLGKPPRTRSGPKVLTMPYPVVTEDAPERRLGDKAAADFLAGGDATSKAGIPWYGPAMLFGGLAGVAGGWKGVDLLLDRARKKDRAAELDEARGQFHDALLAQYERPYAAGARKAAADLDRLFDGLEKAATLLNNAGAALGGYGMYAGLSGLLTGALVYEKARKRGRSAILEKALQRRQRRRQVQQPAEILAVPEPVESLPRPDPNDEAGLLSFA